MINLLIKEASEHINLYDEETVNIENEFLSNYISNKNEDDETSNEASLSILNRKLLNINNIIGSR